MTFVVFFVVLVALLTLRTAPILLVKLYRAVPFGRYLQQAHHVSTLLQQNAGESATVPPQSFLRVRRLVLVASSVLAVIALVTTALLNWHSAELLLMLQ